MTYEARATSEIVFVFNANESNDGHVWYFYAKIYLLLPMLLFALIT